LNEADTLIANCSPGMISDFINRIVPVLINSGMSEELFHNLLQMYKPSYIFTPSDKGIMNEEYQKINEYCDYSLLKTNYIIDYSLNDELALLLTTSGSTGSPKLVRQSYQNINSNAASIVKYLGITSEDRAITTMPMSYTYDLSIINSHMMQGATIIANDYTLMDKEFWTLLKDEHATLLGEFPMYMRC
jgi:long-subunit acyl-CoA synthetase (AMP-forming)